LVTRLDIGPTVGTNQRRGSSPSQRAYPWLLAISTLLAGGFCYLYLTKPVIHTGSAASATEPSLPAAPSKPAITTPADRLPGDPASKPAVVAPESLAENRDAYEETNLRIQHILGATGPDGESLGRITLEVPVLYESSVVRWTEEDVTRARSLLGRIQQYQQRSRELRDEAVGLIAEWDDLIVNSIPDTSLRADSPTLPENQGPGTADQAPFRSNESIEIESR
jgi:hypothetical protein